MKGIFYKNGIYVLIENDEEHDDCIYHYNYRDDISLFGGRTYIRYRDSDNAFLTIDGISIMEITSATTTNYDLPLSKIVSYLNAIEVNGVDAFLQNYKQSVELFYDELKNISQITVEQLSSIQEDSKTKNLLLELEKIRKLLLSVLAVLFSLKVYMAAGLENEKVISVCQSIMDSFA